MTDREVFDAWFDDAFGGTSIAPSLREMAFRFWFEGRRSVLAASGAPVEMRILPEVA